eukprot:IDg6315t1
MAVGDLLQIDEYINIQDGWPVEEDLFAADFQKFKKLRLPPKEKFRKVDASSVAELNIDQVPEDF